MPSPAYPQPVVPVARAAWNGAPPLHNGLAFARRVSVSTYEVGTLGAAVSFVQGGQYFTACRHVVGQTDNDDGDPLHLWTPQATWATCNDLCRISDTVQPGVQAHDALDLVFVRSTIAAQSVTAGHPVVGTVAQPPPSGTALRYLGCRRTGWYVSHFDGPFDWTQHGPAFQSPTMHQLALDAFGVLRMDDPARPYDPNDFFGDSGSALWMTDAADNAACVGHLVGVSATQPLGLAVLYWPALQMLHIAPNAYRIL